MKTNPIPIIFFLIIQLSGIIAQEKNNDYIEFNDRKNIVHGIYLGINTGYGKIDRRNTINAGIKLAYVANRKFEYGIAAKFFYSDQTSADNISSNDISSTTGDVVGTYGGVHLEPILFSKSKINVSFPILIGPGVVAYIEESSSNKGEHEATTSDQVFVVEPGVNILFNFSRYVQIEAGAKYRFSSKFTIHPDAITRINGYSIDLGIKIGVFNLGRNRYKKKLSNES
ncbi:hypothetical protein ACFSTE_22760 [Aquimarina hainanensis]|uniref:Outer membrane protein beta-barrel domain-containing protein n=1 Tax=Aquimarina hainanensis TaxID=1578017 RepID=A0ABW5NHE8_9FLAO